ncbi:MAG TPA: UDP-N-acetylmuramate dehydrogenase [Polyangiaceae bacterium]|nr:UDP-N-acetylmuramate dehydrogenase [Polyangiaceae bacterium]
MVELEAGRDSRSPFQTLEPARDVSLAELCTMQVGGRADYFVEAKSEHAVALALRWAGEQGLRARVLGGGSNVVVSDQGVRGLVLAIRTRGVESRELGQGEVLLSASAGEPWDEFVSAAVERDLQGLECLSGIPGLVGATPIQNVGAYGQEVAETIERVRVLDRQTLAACEFDAADCGFAYRDSRFKSEQPERYVVLSVSYRLRRAAPPALRYPELERHVAERGISRPSLREVRESVLAVRAKKSMLLDPPTENSRSCGSFFVNPIVSTELASEVRARAGNASVPSWAQEGGRVKLAAAWLIEQAGFVKGERRGSVGLSSKHALCIVCHDGATADAVLSFSALIRERVLQRFGVELTPEPNIWT